jgi:hypothetical protein
MIGTATKADTVTWEAPDTDASDRTEANTPAETAEEPATAAEARAEPVRDARRLVAPEKTPDSVTSIESVESTRMLPSEAARAPEMISTRRLKEATTAVLPAEGAARAVETMAWIARLVDPDEETAPGETARTAADTKEDPEDETEVRTDPVIDALMAVDPEKTPRSPMRMEFSESTRLSPPEVTRTSEKTKSWREMLATTAVDPEDETAGRRTREMAAAFAVDPEG